MDLEGFNNLFMEGKIKEKERNKLEYYQLGIT